MCFAILACALIKLVGVGVVACSLVVGLGALCFGVAFWWAAYFIVCFVWLLLPGFGGGVGLFICCLVYECGLLGLLLVFVFVFPGEWFVLIWIVGCCSCRFLWVLMAAVFGLVVYGLDYCLCGV